MAADGLVKITFDGEEVELVKGTAEAPEIVRYSTEGEAEKAYKEKLETPIKYQYTYDAYTDYKYVPPASLPKEKDQTKWVNDKSKMASRNKAQEEALEKAGYKKPTLQTSEDMRVRQIVNALVAGGWSEEDAVAHAKSMQKPTPPTA